MGWRFPLATTLRVRPPMKRYLAALVVLLFPATGWATCVPSAAKPGMAGCQPVAGTMAPTDYVQIWIPGQYPNSAQIIQLQNLSSYLDLSSPPPIGTTTPNTGDFTNLGATKTITQTLTTAWSGGFPGTNNVGIYAIQAFSGTPASRSYQDLNGYVNPLNLIQMTDQLAINSSFSATVVGLDLNMIVGGGGATGARLGLAVNMTVTGDVGVAGGAVVNGATFFTHAGGNLGGTALTPLGDVYGFSAEVENNVFGTYLYSMFVSEFDFHPLAATYKSSSAFKLANIGTPGIYASAAGGDGAFEISGGGGASWRDFAIVFGNPQNGGDFPVGTSGTLIKSLPGTAAKGIDMSASTLSSNFLQGPGNLFFVDGPLGRVNTNQINAVSANSFAIGSIAGNPMAVS